MRGHELIGGVLAALAVAAVTAGEAQALPLFASPPHFVAGPDRRQVVFFLNEGVHGALAVRAADGTIEVIVPGSSVDATLRGERFSADDARVAGVVLAAAPHGATSIRIETLDPVSEANAHPLDDPPRLVVDLLAAAAAPPATRAPAGATARPSPVATLSAAPSARVTASPRTAPRTATAVPTPVPTVRPTTIPSAVPAAAPSVGARGVRLGDALRAGMRAKAEVEIAPTPQPPLQPAAGEDALPMPCLWQRRDGVAFCAPDPRAAAYAEDGETAALAQALSTPDQEPPAAIALAAARPARPYLEADRVFVSRAASAKLLPAVRAYLSALRLFPDFPDAERARMNMGLALRAMAFGTELRAAAKVAGAAEAGLLHGLAGDLALDLGALDRARADYAAAEKAGGIGACLAARGELAVAFEGTPSDADQAALARLPERCPPELVADPETQLLRARAKLAADDAEGAHALLDGLPERVAPPSRARVMLVAAAVAERTGKTEEARRTYEDLAEGRYGSRAAATASTRLALLDAAGGDLEGGLRRLGRFDDTGAADARRVLVTQALDERKTAAETLALLEEAGVTAQDLPPGDQLQVARSYRLLGFHAEASHVLAGLRKTLGVGVTAEVWEEAGELARTRGGWPAVLALGDEWLRARPDDPAARALRARALAGSGRSKDAMAELAGAVVGLDPVAGRDLRLAVATLIRPHDLPVALQLLQAAEAAGDLPALPDARAAALLWELGDAAEESGDVAGARAAFGTLASRYPGEPAAQLAAYRSARLLARARDGGEAIALYEDAAASGDPLARRAAEAARQYEDLVGALGAQEDR